ncbi:MAG: hypothetical protein ACQGVK_09915 [Myxococcota bacterium]
MVVLLFYAGCASMRTFPKDAYRREGATARDFEHDFVFCFALHSERARQDSAVSFGSPPQLDTPARVARCMELRGWEVFEEPTGKALTVDHETGAVLTGLQSGPEAD